MNQENPVITPGQEPIKIPNVFWLILSLIQILISACHYALYASIMHFFPSLIFCKITLLVVVMFLSVTFFAMTIITFRHDNWFLRFLNLAASVWLPTFFYLLLASLAAIIYEFTYSQHITLVAILFYCVAILLILYGIINARIARVVNLTLNLPNLPSIWKGKTAVLVTDIHLGHILRFKFANKVIQKINSLSPELVFISGDFFDGVKTNFQELAILFNAIKAPQGTYYVTGNHEEIAGYKICEDAISKAGIHILENQKVDLNGLQIAGLAYFTEGKETKEVVAQKLKAMNLDSSKPSILLKHVPNRAVDIAEYGVNLQLSGHTHHGQIWPFRYFTNLVYKGYDYGLKKIGDNYMYTSSGIGTWGPPLRIFTRSEIVRIVFE